MATDFSTLLDIDSDSIKRPPIKPPGTYHATISHTSFGKSAQKGTPFCRLHFVGVSPGEDIDPDMCADSDGVPIDFSKWKPTFDFYLTPDSLYRIKEFMDELRIPGGRKLSERIPEMRNLPVLLTVSMKSNENGDGFFNRVEAVKAA